MDTSDLYLQGYFTSEIARLTNHDPVNVDRYTDDFQRVLSFAGSGWSAFEQDMFLYRAQQRFGYAISRSLSVRKIYYRQLKGGNEENIMKIDSCESRYPEN